MAILLALQGPSPGQIFSLDGPAAVLGRHPGVRYCFGVRVGQPAACADNQHRGQLLYRGPAQPQRHVRQRPIVDRAAIAQGKRRDRHLRIVVRLPLESADTQRHAFRKLQRPRPAKALQSSTMKKFPRVPRSCPNWTYRAVPRACVCRSTPRPNSRPFWKSAGTWAGRSDWSTCCPKFSTAFSRFSSRPTGDSSCLWNRSPAGWCPRQSSTVAPKTRKALKSAARSSIA